MDTKIRFKKADQFFNTIREDLGDFELDSNSSNSTYVDATVTTGVDEITFYKCFLYLKSGLARTIYEDDKIDRSLTAVNIEYMATIMAKPMEFTMPCNSKNDVQKNIAKELGRTARSAYSAINRLKKSGYLVTTEDDLIMPNRELQMLRKVTKTHLDKLNCFPVSYMMNFVVVPVENEQKNGNKEDGDT